MYSKKMKITIVLLILALTVGSLYNIFNDKSRRSIRGILDPLQTQAEGQATLHIGRTELTVDYLYAYDIEALVLHTKNYLPIDLAGKLSPRDLALGWGAVAEYNGSIDFHWRQSGRWYFWRVDSYEELEPIGVEADVNRQSSNNHIIPANKKVKSVISKISQGDHIHLKGYLVDVTGDNFTWTSSTSRTDSGDHSCEVIYVTEAEILD